MPVPTLTELARRACIRNIRSIVDVGDATYDQVRLVLLKVQNAEQLNELETNSPQLVGHTAEIWRAIIKRDIEGFSLEEPPEPSNPASWYRLYRKLRRKEQKAIQEQEDLLADQLRGLKESAAERTSKVVDARTLPRLNRALGGRVEKKHTTTAPRAGDPSMLRFTSGSRTKTASGKDVLNRARREAKEMSLFSMRGSSNLSRPAHLSVHRASAPSKAPKALVEEHRRPSGYNDNDTSTGRIVVPRRSKSTAQQMPPSTSSPISPGPSKMDNLITPPQQAESGTFGRKMSKVPRVTAPGPESRDKSLDRSSTTTQRPRPQVDIFIPAKKRKKAC